MDYDPRIAQLPTAWVYDVLMWTVKLIVAWFVIRSAVYSAVHKRPLVPEFLRKFFAEVDEVRKDAKRQMK